MLNHFELYNGRTDRWNKSGCNVLGLQGEEEVFLLILCTIVWTNVALGASTLKVGGGSKWLNPSSANTMAKVTGLPVVRNSRSTLC